MSTLTDKVALVTGASSVVGKIVAHAYARSGAKVVVADSDESAGMDVCESLLYEGAQAIFVPVDAFDPGHHKYVIEETLEAFGALHVVCNNAGVSAPLRDLVAFPIEGLESVTSVDLSDVFYGLHFQIPALLESGGGSIVNVSSVFLRSAVSGDQNVQQPISCEYAIQHINIHALHDRERFTGSAYDAGVIKEDETVEGVAQLQPMRRLKRASDAAALVMWLSSPQKRLSSGAYYAVEGD